MTRGHALELDNGQHILIGAYTDTLRLMALVGVDVEQAFLRIPLQMMYPDGTGLSLPDWPSPLDVLAGVTRARGWSLGDKWSLLRTAMGWQWQGFECPEATTVAELCRNMTERLRREFIEPLCVSALNTPAERASARVFLRVLKDSLFGVPRGSNLLLPRVPLGQLWPQAAVAWLQQRPQTAGLHLATRVAPPTPTGPGLWRLHGEEFDHVVWANFDQICLGSLADIGLFATDEFTPAGDALVKRPPPASADSPASGDNPELAFEAIATVYAWSGTPAPTGQATLTRPMLALRSDPRQPAQFVFDRGQLGGPAGLLAFVVSASRQTVAELAQAVQHQASCQLGLDIRVIRTLVEKRATFACTPGLVRPPMRWAPGLVGAGDHIRGPYPATLEGAVRSGWAAGEVTGTQPPSA